MGKHKHVLVIGGRGFIGSHLTRALQRLGYLCTTLGINPINKSEAPPRTSHAVCDLADFKALKRQIRDLRPDFVVNLGGYINHGSEPSVAETVLNEHFFGVRNLAEVCGEIGVKRFIQIGSSDEYGVNENIKFEIMKDYPISHYGFSKSMATQYLQMLNRASKFPVVILRLFLVYGPGQKLDRFIPGLINSALSNNVFSVTSGHQKRDFCYVEDVVGGIIASLDSKISVGEVINLGSGEGITIREIVDEFRKYLPNLQVTFGERESNSGDLFDSVADISKAKLLLNWTPRTPLADGLPKTVAHYAENH